MVPLASQYKYNCANLSKKVCYEAANLMGGSGVCDNILMYDYMNISRILEVIGGTKHIQQLIMSRGLKNMFKNL